MLACLFALIGAVLLVFFTVYTHHLCVGISSVIRYRFGFLLVDAKETIHLSMFKRVFKQNI